MPKALISYVSHDAGGVLYVNTLAVDAHSVTVPVVDEPDLHETVDAVDTWLTTQYLKCLHTDYTLDRIEARGILGDTGDYVKTKGVAGTYSPASTQRIPKELALVITLKTAQATRSGHGRIFMPSGRSADALGDATSWRVITDESTYWKECSDLAAMLDDGHDFNFGPLSAEAGHVQIGVWSRVHNAFYNVTSAFPRTQYHWLRSRSTAP